MRLSHLYHPGSRVVTWIFWVLTIAVLVDLARTGWFQPKRISAQPAPGSSYTVTLDQTFTRNGQTRHVNTEVYAVRSDGSRMSRFSNSSTAPHPEVFRTLYLASGNMVHIREIAGLTSTKAISVPQPRSAMSSCALGSDTYAGQEFVNGFRAAKLTQGSTTSWYALDYGCALVHDKKIWDDGAVSEKTLVSLVAGEPDPALFHVPVGYREVSLEQWRKPFGQSMVMEHHEPSSHAANSKQ